MANRFFTIITTTLIALHLAFVGATAQAADGKKTTAKTDAIRLEQIHYLLGNTVLTANQRGLRIESAGNLHFILVARAPDWTVHIFRDDDKLIKSMTLQQFDNAGLMPQFVQTSREKFLPTTANPYQFKYFGFNACRNVTRYQVQEYLPIRDLVAPQVERIVFAAYRLPSNGGLLLKYIGTAGSRDYIAGIEQRGRKETSLTTVRIAQTKVDADIFTAPTGYKQAKSLQDVVVGQQGRDRGNAYQYMLDPKAKATN